MSKLYIVSTPIGNIDDISARAKEVLSNVETIIAEDTRQIGKLLDLLDLPKKNYISYRDQNRDKVLSEILALLEADQDLALVSDRGTPLISDPGYKLVEATLEKNHTVVPIPGPTALTTALVGSGLPTDKFSFVGFLPKKRGKAKSLLQQFMQLPATVIAYESPFRIFKTLEIISEIDPEARVVLARELTKMHEEFLRGRAGELLKQIEGKKLKGEFVILIN